MIISVVREYKWTPKYLSTLYLDDQDHRGLVFWYNDIIELIKKSKAKK